MVSQMLCSHVIRRASDPRCVFLHLRCQRRGAKTLNSPFSTLPGLHFLPTLPSVLFMGRIPPNVMSEFL